MRTFRNIFQLSQLYYCCSKIPTSYFSFRNHQEPPSMIAFIKYVSCTFDVRLLFQQQYDYFCFFFMDNGKLRKQAYMQRWSKRIQRRMQYYVMCSFTKKDLTLMRATTFKMMRLVNELTVFVLTFVIFFKRRNLVKKIKII